MFSYTRQITKIGPDGSEELWHEKTYVTTEEAFPTVLRRSEVVNVTVEEISPVEMALEEILKANRDLEALNLRFTTLAKTGQTVDTNLLTMALNAVVDTPLDSGVTAFRQSFLTGEYMSRFPDRVEQVEKLRTAIDDQVCVH